MTFNAKEGLLKAHPFERAKSGGELPERLRPEVQGKLVRSLIQMRRRFDSIACADYSLMSLLSSLPA